ncbi:uncharacterized protein LOC117282834 [Cryptotermes secundus]|uniref:uncharacterized protein LOC117282834 n=1 Tax=Cryptotermes secundus TaxID=105785 RepID=UPI001454DD4A|nr:uncharacterized protein LOC117282834 [Cryptotermes secundus]
MGTLDTTHIALVHRAILLRSLSLVGDYCKEEVYPRVRSGLSTAVARTRSTETRTVNHGSEDLQPEESPLSLKNDLSTTAKPTTSTQTLTVNHGSEDLQPEESPLSLKNDLSTTAKPTTSTQTLGKDAQKQLAAEDAETPCTSKIHNVDENEAEVENFSKGTEMTSDRVSRSIHKELHNLAVPKEIKSAITTMKDNPLIKKMSRCLKNGSPKEEELPADGQIDSLKEERDLMSALERADADLMALRKSVEHFNEDCSILCPCRF